MFLKEIESKPPEGVMKIAIEKMEEAGHGIPEIMHLFRFKKRSTDHLIRFTDQVMRGPSALSHGTRELIGAFVSLRNQCSFCASAHAPVAAQLLGEDLVQEVMTDFESSRLDRRHKALFRYLAKLTENSSNIVPEDIHALKKAGWSEEAIYDALTVAAMFKFYNTWNNGAGVALMSNADFAHSSNRLLTMGYCMDFGFRALLKVLWVGRKEIRFADLLELMKIWFRNVAGWFGLSAREPARVRVPTGCALTAFSSEDLHHQRQEPTSVSLVQTGDPAA